MGEPAKTVVARRIHSRATLKTAVHFSSESNFYTGFMDNISEGGVFAATFNLQPLGATVDVEFSLPDNKPPVKVRAEVRWLRDYDPDSDLYPGMGLRFLDLADAERVRIESFVQQRDTIFYDDE